MHAKCILHTCLVTLESKEKRKRYIYEKERKRICQFTINQIIFK